MMHWDELTHEEQTAIKRRLAYPFEPADHRVAAPGHLRKDDNG